MQQTLGQLHPNDGLEVNPKHSKMDVRPFGSYVYPFAKPNRQPEGGRVYVPGDPIRFIDWKAYAKSDQLILREKKEEISGKIAIYIDTSASMNWPKDEEIFTKNPDRICTSKLELAYRIAFNLAHHHLKAGDQVALYFVDEKIESTYYKKIKFRSSNDVQSLFLNVCSVKDGFDSDFATKVATPHNNFQAAADVAYWLGDLIFNKRYQKLLSQHRVSLLLQTLSNFETNIDWLEASISYRDLAKKKEFLGRDLLSNDQYLFQLNRWFDTLQLEAKELSYAYLLLTDATPVHFYASYIKQLGVL
ncbi:MAG: DUF58 domain-containing protein [Oligoflexales bacterium]|nr:DUF58 domain-containing protein [Oligoflexales bacterium]